MKAEEVLAEFKFYGNRVSKFNFDSRLVNSGGQQKEISFEFDYNVKAIEEHEDNLVGIIEFIVKARATYKRKLFFKTELVMEGAFACNAQTDMSDRFLEMLEINGVVTLSQLARAYLLSVTSQSGIPPVRMPMINIKMLREKKKIMED